MTGQELAGGQLTSDDPHPHHELVGLVFFLFLELGAEVAVVLLVRPVKLEDRSGILAEMVHAIMDLVSDKRLQVSAGNLDRLDLAGLRTVSSSGWLHASSPLSGVITMIQNPACSRGPGQSLLLQ